MNIELYITRGRCPCYGQCWGSIAVIEIHTWIY